MAEWAVLLGWERFSGNWALQSSCLSWKECWAHRTTHRRQGGPSTYAEKWAHDSFESPAGFQRPIRLLKLTTVDIFSTLNVFKADKHRCVQGHGEGLLNREVESALRKGSHGQVRDVEVSMSQRTLGRQELPLQALVAASPWLCVCARVAGQPWVSTASHG